MAQSVSARLLGKSSIPGFRILVLSFFRSLQLRQFKYPNNGELMERRRVKCAQRRPHACHLNHSYELSTLNKDALLFCFFTFWLHHCRRHFERWRQAQRWGAVPYFSSLASSPSYAQQDDNRMLVIPVKGTENFTRLRHNATSTYFHSFIRDFISYTSLKSNNQKNTRYFPYHTQIKRR